MKNLLPLLAAALLVGCATQQPISEFKPVSLKPVAKAVTQTQQHITSSQSAAKKLADECAQKSEGWQAAYQQLNDELTQAYLAAQVAQDAVRDKTEEIVAQTNDANKVVAERNKAVAKVAVEHARGNKWMKYSMLEGVLLLLALTWMTKGIWLKALVALMLMTATLQANVGDTEAQWRNRITNSKFEEAPLDISQARWIHGKQVIASNEHFYCLTWIIDDKVVVESFILHDDIAFEREDFAFCLAPYGKPGTFVPLGEGPDGVMRGTNASGSVLIYYGPMKKMGAEHVLTIIDKAFDDKVAAHNEQVSYSPPSPIYWPDDSEEPAHTIQRA